MESGVIEFKSFGDFRRERLTKKRRKVSEKEPAEIEAELLAVIAAHEGRR